MVKWYLPDSEICGSMRLFQATKLCILYLSFYMNYPQTGIYHLPASLYAVEEEHHASVWILYKHKGKPRLSMGSKINSRENLISSNFCISGKILLEKLEELYSQQCD